MTCHFQCKGAKPSLAINHQASSTVSSTFIKHHSASYLHHISIHTVTQASTAPSFLIHHISIITNSRIFQGYHESCSFEALEVDRGIGHLGGAAKLATVVVRFAFHAHDLHQPESRVAVAGVRSLRWRSHRRRRLRRGCSDDKIGWFMGRFTLDTLVFTTNDAGFLDVS